MLKRGCPPFKVLLVLDNALGHPALTFILMLRWFIFYLISLLQPMDLAVIASFKADYRRKTFAMAFRVIEKDKDLTLKDFWKFYHIATIKNISDSCDEVKLTNLNGVWKTCVPSLWMISMASRRQLRLSKNCLPK